MFPWSDRANTAAGDGVIIKVGDLPIKIQTSDLAFQEMLRSRYRDYLSTGPEFRIALSVQLKNPEAFRSNADVEVWLEGRTWRLRRGDFDAFWDPEEGRGCLTQSANPYSIDSVLRILHSLLLAPQGGFLLHASSVMRNERAMLFSGVSEAGKTTMARLAPSDATVLTDEASYVRKVNHDYLAYGTPFAGELGEPGANIHGKIAAVYLLHKAIANSVRRLTPAEAIPRLLRNVLYFAREADAVSSVFDAICGFVASVPIYQLSFYPDQHVWEILQ